MQRYISNLFCGLIIAILATQAGSAAYETSSGAPRGYDGRFTNIDGEIGHGSFAVRFPFPLFFLRLVGH